MGKLSPSHAFSYWRRVMREALDGSKEFLGVANPVRLSVTLFSFLLAVVVLRLIGGREQVSEEVRWGVAIVLAAGILFVPTFLVNLFLAPVKMEDALIKTRDELQKNLEQRTNRREIAEGLRNFHNEGVRLQSGISTGLSMKEIIDQFVAWDKEVFQFLDERISYGKAAYVTAVPLPPSAMRALERLTTSNEYADALRSILLELMGTRLERLRELMKEY